MKQVELVDFVGENLAHLLRPLLFLRLFNQFGTLWRTLAVAQFLLDVFDLLLQEILALLLVDVLARFRADVLPQLQQLNLLVQRFQHLDHALHHRCRAYHSHSVGNAERHVRTDEIHGQHLILDVVQRELRLVGNVLVLVDVFDGRVAQVVEGRAPGFVAFLRHFLRRNRRLSHDVRMVCREFLQPTATQCLHDNRQVVAAENRHVENPHEFRVGAEFAEVALLRLLDFRIFLAEHRKRHVRVPLQLVHQIETLLSSDDNRRDDARKQHDVARRQNRHFALDLHREDFRDVALEVGNHLYRSICSFIHRSIQLLILNLQRYDFSGE